MFVVWNKRTDEPFFQLNMEDLSIPVISHKVFLTKAMTIEYMVRYFRCESKSSGKFKEVLKYYAPKKVKVFIDGSHTEKED